MGKKYSEFLYNIGDTVDTFGRNLRIIDRFYVKKNRTKNGVQYTLNEKRYKYLCNECQNIDEISEYSLNSRRNSGCNCCCTNPKKIVSGKNDVATTAPWMVNLIKGGNEVASKYAKYSNKKIEFVCPDCGNIVINSIRNVYANHGISCICSDAISYPNKFMYKLLSNIGVEFEIEKVFEWSKNKRYDFYIGKLNAIIEMNGAQHYEEVKWSSEKSITLDDEIKNDKFKEEVAKENGIIFYFQIDCRKSDPEYIGKSIERSGLLNLLGCDSESIDYTDCDKFATSNFAKTICTFKEIHADATLHEISDIFKISYKTVLEYVKRGNKFGWCDYTMFDDLHIKNRDRGQKPIHCITDGLYFRSSSEASEYLSNDEYKFAPRQIRQSIARNNTLFGKKFEFIDRELFNKIKKENCNVAIGEYFK